MVGVGLDSAADRLAANKTEVRNEIRVRKIRISPRREWGGVYRVVHKYRKWDVLLRYFNLRRTSAEFFEPNAIQLHTAYSKESCRPGSGT